MSGVQSVIMPYFQWKRKQRSQILSEFKRADRNIGPIKPLKTLLPQLEQISATAAPRFKN